MIGPILAGMIAAQATPPVLDPSSALLDNDYPAEALLNGWEGVSRVRVFIDRKGKVEGCDVVESSGHEVLDKMTCVTLSRLRFKPARDEQGKPVAAMVERRMNWRLPGSRRRRP